MRVVLFLTATVALVGLSGCEVRKSGNSIRISMGARHSDDLQPDKVPYAKGQLLMNGHPFPVAIASTKRGDTVTHTLLSEGVAIESETYVSDPGQFCLGAFGDEVFQPTIPLLKFPLNVGDTWNWKGRFGAKENLIPAEATIKTEWDPLNLERFGATNAVRAEVTLVYGGSGQFQAERKLQFWFSEAQGMVKRQVHFGSTRVP